MPQNSTYCGGGLAPRYECEMSETIFFLRTEQETAALGAALGDVLCVGDVVLLSGPLGAGKTTLARSAIHRRCGTTDAPSPTFTLVETYSADDLTIWHFDFYRLERAEEAWELGVEEAFADGASLIEWPERAPSILPAHALSITLTVDGGRRRAIVKGSPAWRERLEKIAAAFENQTRNPPSSTVPGQ